MPKTIAIFLPTYKRPHTLADVTKNIEATTLHPFTLYFGVEKEDRASQIAARLTGHKVVINKYEPGYANTIQSMYEVSDEPFWLHANDDFEFTHHWDEVPIAMFEREDLMVVGLRQHESDRSGSAICMGRRRYIEQMSGVIDIPNRVFYPYNHNFIDTEFTQTAQKRGVWAKCDPLVIHHMHPGFTGKDKDETYKKNDATFEADERTFNQRKHLWMWYYNFIKRKQIWKNLTLKLTGQNY